MDFYYIALTIKTTIMADILFILFILATLVVSIIILVPTIAAILVIIKKLVDHIIKQLLT